MDLSSQTPSGETTYSMNPTASPAIEPGTILLGKFRVVGNLGVGGMGTVYRIDHLLMERQFALKCLNKFQEANASWKRFQNEAKAAHLLDHPNLLKVFEFGLLESGQPFFLMELIEGVTLSDEIKRLGHLPVERAVGIFIQVAFAIGYAHERKVIHRDLKPSNIMLVPPRSDREVEAVKVVDFGLAKLTGIDEFNQQSLTKTGEVFGSPFYMSPEQCMGLPVDHRSDIYSLGCVFYETLTSAPPFMGESALSTMMKHQSEAQLPLKEASLGLSFPGALESIIGKMLEKDPDKRYQSADFLAADLIALERILNENKQMTSGPSPSLAAGAKETARQDKVKALLKSMTIAKLLIFGLSMYVTGLASAYLFLGYFGKDQGQPIAYTPPRTEPLINEQGQQFWSQIEGNKKIFYFPDNKAIGRLMLATGENGNAIGRVQVPLGVKTGLIATAYLFEHREFIEKFRPEEISVFDFYANDVSSEQIASIKRFTDLRCLNASGTAFGDREIAMLPTFKHLQYLNLCTTDLNCENLLKLPSIYQLNGLDVSHTLGAELVVKAVHKFPNLQFLAVSACGIGDGDIHYLAASKTLRILCISTNTLTDSAIEKLTPIKTLEWLDINRTLVTPKCVESLKKFPKLRTLEVGLRTDWSNEDRAKFVRELKKTHPKLEVLFQDIGTYDPSAMPGFAWQGGGLASHSNFRRIVPSPPTDSITERRLAPLTPAQ